MVTAKLHRANLKGFNGVAHLYVLSEPVEYDWDNSLDKNTATTYFVVISANVVPGSGPETYIFAANSDGIITDFLELAGSYRGGLEHNQAIWNAGWELISD